MKKLLLTLFAAAMMLGVQNANASVKLTALSGSVGGDRNNNGGNANEGPAALVDEQTNSKFGTWDGYYSQPVYIIMKSSAAIAPKSYELISANDTYNDTGRSWSQWKIYGGNFASDAEATIDAEGWVLIDSKENQTLDKGSAPTDKNKQAPFAVNKKDISETIASGTYYTYFKIVVEALEGGWSKYCQMDGFRFTNVKFKPQDVTFTYSAGSGIGNRENEGMDKLFDLDCNTKYCGNTGSDCYALVTASEPVFVWGYDLTTANDNNGGRKVTKWSLYGTNDATIAANANADGWVALSNMAGNSYIEGKNWYTQRFFCNKNTIGNAYKYFKVTLDEGGFVQLSAFRFCYDTYRAIAYNHKSGPSGSGYAVDGLPNPKWEGNASVFTGAGNAVTIETSDGNSYAVKKYHFTTNDDGSWKNRAPKSWTIEGSDDNSSWTKIAEVDDAYAIHNANYTTYEFTPDNTTDAFRYIRLTLNSMKTTGWSQIGDFQVLAVSDVSDKDYYTNRVDDAKAAASGYETLMGSTDPWYVEYKALIDGLDATLASSISSGDYDPISTALLNVDYMVGLMTPFAEGSAYSAVDASACFNDSPYSQLFDGKDGREGRQGTKWGGNFSGSEGDPEHVQYVIFRVKSAFAPYFYKLVTGGDTHTYTGRNWKSWSVYGGNFSTVAAAKDTTSTSWTLLDQRVDISEEYLPMENNYPAAFNFNQGVSDDYYYYMVKVFAAHSGSQIQMNEMYLCTEEEFDAARDPLVAYFDDFDKTRPIEASKNTQMANFNTLYDELQSTDDAVRMTLVYNQLVALRAELEESMDYLDFYAAKTVEGVFQLGTADELKTFASAVNNGRPALNAVLTADINLNEIAWTPIGNSSNKYTGTFDGQNHAITNFSYTSTGDYNGLFGFINNATVKNFSISGSLTSTHKENGAIGYADGASVVSGVHSSLDITVNCRTHSGGVVGASGEATSTLRVDGCSYSGTLTIEGTDADVTGGIIGYTYYGTIQNCIFSGTINGNVDDKPYGGILGYARQETFGGIHNCLVLGKIVTNASNTTASILIGKWNGSATSKVDNNYYLPNAGSSENVVLVGGNTDNVTAPVEVNATQLSSGEVTYKLNKNSCYDVAWTQTLGTNNVPTLDKTKGIVNKISSVGYTTQYITDTDVTIPTGIEAFTGEFNGEEWLRLVSVSSKIAANEPVILRGDEGYYSFERTTGAEKVTDNVLRGSDGTVTGGSGIYALANKSDVVGFYPVDSSVTIPAGKAYLNTSAGVKGFTFVFEDTEDGISSLTPALSEGEGAIYNLAGQKLSKMQKGISIVNGRKVLK